MKKILFFLIGLCFLSAVENQPWFGNLYEFHLLGEYSYSYFNKIEGASNRYTKNAPPSNANRSKFYYQNLCYLDLEFSFSPKWDIDAEMQFAQTNEKSFNFRTGALQLRYIILDDFVGDAVSLVCGISLRGVPKNQLSDVSSPFHGKFEADANVAIGKELSVKENCFALRPWICGRVGFCLDGSPWLYGIFGMDSNFYEKYKISIFSDISQSYGKNHIIYLGEFNGYGKVRAKFVDVGIRYGCRLGVYGTLRLEYIRRCYAKLAPMNVNSFVIGYLYPFSF